jgi:hypothetical protein
MRTQRFRNTFIAQKHPTKGEPWKSHVMLPYLEHFGNYTNPFQWAKVNPLTTQNQGLPRIARIASLVKKWGHTQIYANVDRESMGK